MAFAAGYGVAAVCQMTTYAAQAPVAATAAAAALTMVLVSGSSRLLSGAFRGLGIGLAAGVGSAMAVMPTELPAGAEVVWQMVAAGTIVAVMAAHWVGPVSAVAGVGTALFTPVVKQRVEMRSLQTLAAMLVLVPAICCFAVGALFGMLSARRRRAT